MTPVAVTKMTSLSNKKTKPLFLCDVDDVVADFVQGFNAAVIATGVRDIKMDHVHTTWDLSKSLKLTKSEDQKVYSLVDMPGFASRLNPCVGAVDGVKKIMQVADVIWVTHELESSPTWVYDRRLWLEKYFGEGQKIVNTSEKYAVDGDYFLDDKPAHCAAWHAQHPRKMAMMWATGRNGTDAPEGVALIGDWKVVLDTIKLTANTLAEL